jgi:hypothetical protein
MEHLLALFGAAVLAATLVASSLETKAQTKQPNLRRLCMDHYGVSYVARAYIDGSGKLICYIPLIEFGSATNKTSGGARQNFNRPTVRKKHK